MKETKYNGWTNYETWAVNLWMTNDEGSYRYWQEVAEEIRQEQAESNDEWGECTPHDFCVVMAERLKAEHEEQMPEIQGVYADLLGAALGEVNWWEIAEHYVDDLPTREEEEEEARSE